MKSILSVTTAAATYDLTTLENMLSELGLTDPSQAEMDLISRHITQVSIAIANYCDRVFPSETVVETFWMDRSSWGLPVFWQSPALYQGYFTAEDLRLERTPVTSITSIVLDGVTLSPITLWRLDDREGIIYRLDDSEFLSCWSFAKTAVVTYVGGYLEIPADLERAARLWASSAWFAAAQDATVRSEEIYDIARVDYSINTNAVGRNMPSIPPDVEALLEPYTRKGIFA